MIKEKLSKYVAQFKEMTPTTQGFIIVGILLIIGIILRWDYISSEVVRGFDFFSKK